MKLSNALLVVLIAFVSFSFASTPISEPKVDIEPPRWEKLGQRKVNYGLDRDEIFVTARDGRFSKIKLRVKNGGLNMHRCVIHFANGSKQNVEMRNNLAPGSETRVIDINGGRRVIKKVVFWYDSKNWSQKKAVVALWGRH
jgi:hypothetical protein